MKSVHADIQNPDMKTPTKTTGVKWSATSKGANAKYSMKSHQKGQSGGYQYSQMKGTQMQQKCYDPKQESKTEYEIIFLSKYEESNLYHTYHQVIDKIIEKREINQNG